MEEQKVIPIIFLLLVGLLASTALAKPASVLLQEGLFAEEIEGDLDAAIEIYNKVTTEAGAAENFVAYAAYRIGLCYVKKGQEAEAAEQFKYVISDFAEQAEVVAKAKEQLSRLDVEDEPETKVVADGYPVSAGSSSIGAVVPRGLYNDLVLYYSFYSDQDLETVMNISGSGYEGRVHGATYTTDEILGGTMYFDGHDDYISAENVELKEFTFSAWVATSESGINNRRIFTLDDGKNCYGLQGCVRGGLSIYVAQDVEAEIEGEVRLGLRARGASNTREFHEIETKGNVKEFSDYDWSFAESTWTHITLTYDGQTFKLYRNGSLTETGDIPSSGVTGTLYIGGTDAHRGGFWHGFIDEVAVFNRALTDEQVQKLFNMTGELGEGIKAAKLQNEALSVGRNKILFGTVVDERGNGIPDAKVFGSFAQRGRADANGKFALVTSPDDSSNSLGPADFPMFVWSFPEDDPDRVAWTVIRHPNGHSSQDSGVLVEKTYQGVELRITNEEQLDQSIPGDPGQLFEDLDSDPKVKDIVLEMGPAGSVSGQVTNATGEPVANARVSIERLEIKLGDNRVIITNLDHEWKAEVFALTDNSGSYSLNNLPASWDNISLKAEAKGFKVQQQLFESGGQSNLPSCNFELVGGVRAPRGVRALGRPRR